MVTRFRQIIKQGIYSFAGFNLLFLLFQLIYSFSLSASFIHAVTLPWKVYAELIAAFLLQIILHALLALFQVFLLWGITPIPISQKHLDRRILTILITSLSAILSLNCYFFPLSAFSKLFVPGLPLFLITTALLISLGLLLLASLISLYRLCLLNTKVSISITILLIILLLPWPKKETRFSTSTSPNIIIIGVDSLSPDQVSKAHTPFIAQFLDKSVHFTNTVSPLARTYSAWASILTGLHPLHHRARENLISKKEIDSAASFAWTLKNAGYQTIFATDDRRFNNLGEEFGFQKIVGPKIGANDVLLGSFYDFPLSNFLINFRLSRWLLPYNYMNRAGHFAYYPETFDKELQHSILELNTKKPVFLAVHFTLPHWPYAWAASSAAQVKNEYSLEEREGLYFAALHKVDQQVKTLVEFLQKTAITDNSLIILLSDHGEVLYKKGSRKIDPRLYQGTGSSRLESYFPKKTATELQRSAGHGSDLLSPDQFFCVLGMVSFQQGATISPVKTVQDRVVLMDIAPTVYSYLKIHPTLLSDGVSLAGFLGTQTHLNEQSRPVMLESGFLPNSALSNEKAVEYGKLLFWVNPQTDDLEIRPDRWPLIDAMKLYGILDGDWLLALYPDNETYITVILNLKTGEWTDEAQSAFAKHSPRQKLLEQLLNFYQKQLSSYPQTPPAFKEMPKISNPPT